MIGRGMSGGDGELGKMIGRGEMAEGRRFGPIKQNMPFGPMLARLRRTQA